MDLIIFPLFVLQKDSEIHNIYVGDEITIPIYENLLNDKAGIPSLDHIRRINIFDLKN